MCGISGAISNRYISHRSLNSMNEVIKHRGPDDEGFVLFDQNEFEVLGGMDTTKDSWKSNELYSPKKNINTSSFLANVGLGHRRLSILDLSPKGHQPMCSKDERYWITFNGEVYNYLEIRDDLIALGYEFHTNTDTEVVLSAYQEWGIECQNRFNGMWAFAIYDRIEKSIFISRDRFGIKPLYYWFNNDGDFFFASEIKQFTVLPDWKAVLNRERAFDYLIHGLTDHTEETLFLGVYNLPPAHYIFDKIINLVGNNSNLKKQKWYSINEVKSNITFDEAKDKFLEMFKDSIRLHLRSDVAVGSALSGGLDSSSIVSYINLYLKHINKTELQKTFSSCSEDLKFDERVWMEEVVKENKVDAYYIYPRGEDIFRITEKLIWLMDEPYTSQSAFLGYHVFNEAKKNNVKVLLNGQGADEYLSGYGAFRELRIKIALRNFKLKTLIPELKKPKVVIKILLKQLFPQLSKQRKKRKLILNLLNTSIIKNEFSTYSDLKTINEISSKQLFIDPLPRFLRWEDRNSMANSVEARVPFLDYRLIEFVHSLPIDYLDAPNVTKRLLVEALKGILPERVRMRKDKKGFITPEQKWFIDEHYNDFIKMFDDSVQFSRGVIIDNEARNYFEKMKNKQIPFDYSYWRIILFCVWMKVFDVRLA